MLSLAEKVLALKSASVFRQTPDEVLADVANQVEELVFGKDEIIFRKGDHGDSLYIIVSGRVEVRDGERLLNQLDEGAIFGELALLDPAPRSATVKTLEPARLLRLNEAKFQKVLAERPEVSAAIIHVLTSYIRGLLASSQPVDVSRKDAETFEP
ncbi:MAG TPA: cyclic nucleotide-binding domain-containing protein [Anaerolineales bacterium]|nr:cyclic nucleotide-binding domain-containing protein [Anaerolineales bacterium]